MDVQIISLQVTILKFWCRGDLRGDVFSEELIFWFSSKSSCKLIISHFCLAVLCEGSQNVVCTVFFCCCCPHRDTKVIERSLRNKAVSVSSFFCCFEQAATADTGQSHQGKDHHHQNRWITTFTFVQQVGFVSQVVEIAFQFSGWDHSAERYDKY